MDKKTTTTLGIALGASLLAGAGYGIYKYFRNKTGHKDGNKNIRSGRDVDNGLTSGFIGNSLVKSSKLYGRDQEENELVGGGLYKA